MKTMRRALMAAFALSQLISAQEAGTSTEQKSTEAPKTPEVKPEAPKVEVAKPVEVKAEAPKAVEAPKPEAKKEAPAEPKIPADVPSGPAPKPAPVKTDVALKQTESKDIKVAPAAPTIPAQSSIWKKFDETQKGMIALVNESEQYAQKNPNDKERILEQLGMIMGITIAGLEKVSGEKLLDFDAMQEAPPAPKTTKQPERPVQMPAAAEKLPAPAPMPKPEPAIKKMDVAPIVPAAQLPAVKPELEKPADVKPQMVETPAAAEKKVSLRRGSRTARRMA